MKVVVILGCIVFLAAILRLSLLGGFPPGVTGDEIQQGYSAYSILKTGKDEWGDFLPIFPRSFGDYRPPLYIYLTVPAVALFGLSIEVVRSTSAVFGVLTVLVVFFLTKELFKDKLTALLSALFLAISSWHVFYSRAAWESNVGVFFFLAGVLFLLKGLRNSKFLIISSICFGLTLFSYYSFKLLTPLFLAGCLILYRKELLNRKRNSLIFIAISVVFILVMVFGDIFSGGGRRASDAAIYNPENIVGLRDIQVSDPLPQPWGRVINNKVGYLSTQFLQNYLGYFSMTFLASPNRSDSSLYNLPGEWLLSFWEVALILFAVYLLIRKGFTNESRTLVLWALLAPIPAALTRDYMHTQRVEALLFLAPILAGFGLVQLITRLKRPYFLAGVAVVGFLVLYSLVYRVDHYLFHQFDRPLGGVHYGYDEIFAYTEKNKDKYDQVIFTKEFSEPHIFLAFYSKMNPDYFQGYSETWKGFEKEFKFLDMTNYKLGKYYFKNIEWDRDKKNKNTLIISSDRELPDEVKPMHSVKDPFGNLLFIAVDTNDI